MSFVEQGKLFPKGFAVLGQRRCQLRTTAFQVGDLIVQTADLFVLVGELIFKLRNSFGPFLSRGPSGRFIAQLGIDMRELFFLSLRLQEPGNHSSQEATCNQCDDDGGIVHGVCLAAAA